MLGLGVAGGYGGLAPVDVDTDDPALVDIIKRHLPPATVTKVGSRGYTAFYRALEHVPGTTIRVDGKTAVEILPARHTVLPPSPHPNGHEYVWTSERTLFDTPISDLPVITAAMVEAIREALNPAPAFDMPPVGSIPASDVPFSRLAGIRPCRSRERCPRAVSDAAQQRSGQCPVRCSVPPRQVGPPQAYCRGRVGRRAHGRCRDQRTREGEGTQGLPADHQERDQEGGGTAPAHTRCPYSGGRNSTDDDRSDSHETQGEAEADCRRDPPRAGARGGPDYYRSRPDRCPAAGARKAPTAWRS